MPFGLYIRRYREEAGFTLTDFARRIGISPAYWSRIEREWEKPPKDALINKSIQLLGLDPDEAYIQASRLPPDMQEDLRMVVKAYRGQRKAK